MTNTTKLTLGEAAKEVGISKPSLSAAIKKGRVSAHKNESGVFEIDPVELFRVYPPKRKGEQSANTGSLTKANAAENSVSPADDGVLGLLLAERDKLIEEKERAIERLEREKSKIREDLEDQKEQARRITLLLENKSGAGEWDRSLKALEKRLANQEKEAKEYKEKAQKILRQNQSLKRTLDEEKSKGFWQKLFG